MSISVNCADAAYLEALDRRMVGPGGPFELLPTPTPEGPRRDFKGGPRTLVELFDRLERLGERPFLACDEAQLSYADFLRRARAGAAALQRAIRPGDRVALGLPNGLDWLIAFASVVLCGAAVVMTPPGVLETAAEREAAGCACAIRDLDEWRAWLAGGTCDDFVAAAPDPEAEALIAFTSGTSGRPKPVRLDHRGVLAGLRNMMLGSALASLRGSSARAGSGRPAPPCVLVMAPLHHLGGYGQFLLMAQLGGRLFVPRGWSASMAARAIEHHGVRSLQGLLPEMARDLLDLGAGPLGHLASINFYGAPPPGALVRLLKAACPQIEIGAGYGLTETNGSVAVASEHDLRSRPGTAGRISPAVEIRVVAMDGADVPRGAWGEIWLRGPMLAKGYGFGSDAGSAFEGGWLRTGDVGRLDEEGFLHLAEREGETICSSERRFSCASLEQVAQSHPGVRDAAAFGLPDPDLGQRPCLVVVLGPDQDEQAVSIELAGRFDIPELLIVARRRILRTSSGKVDRRGLAGEVGRLGLLA